MIWADGAGCLESTFQILQFGAVLCSNGIRYFCITIVPGIRDRLTAFATSKYEKLNLNTCGILQKLQA